MTGPREPTRAERPTAMAVLSAPATSTPVVRATIMPACGRGRRVGQRDREDGRRGHRHGEDREDDDPGARHARGEQRQARAAGGGEIAEHAGLDVLRPGRGADDHADHHGHHREHEGGVVVPDHAAGGPIPRGVAGVLDARDGEHQERDAQRQERGEHQHAAPAAQLEDFGGDES